ncbi:MAG: DUF4215 domain-containing protein, partial [Deltaproteobacteria bacterium]|nr:DUF4215 domain-containing protein [Deltaproteobacteria bacterium]
GHGFCPGTAIASANLEWRARVTPPANGGSGNQIAMQATTDGLVASLPSASDGTVLQYRVQVTLESGAVLSFPDNPADPYYETFVGDVIPLYCTDFESDPAEDGWHNALLEGTNTEGANDWQWGVSAGTAGSGDPAAAYSGTRVYGNDLGGGDYNGKYQADKVTALYAPVIDVGDHTNIHLQYRRWLTVESGNYDQATIWSNETKVWHNLVPTNGPDVHHEDREWRFQDVDLSSTLTDDHKVQIQFTLNSDGGLEFGGWTIDDFCVVAVPEVPTAVCGNGTVDPEEMCDDGNTDDGDGCSAVCTIEAKPEPVCGNGEIEGDETCDDGNAQNGDGCSADCAIEPPPEPSCGNGEVEGDEACDDGNEQDGDGCEHDCTLTPTDGTGPGSDDGTTPSDGSDGTGSNGSDGSGTSNGSDGANGGADGSDGETSQCTAGTDCPSTVPGPTAPPDGGGCSCQLKVDASNTFGAAAGRSILFILGFAVWIVRRRR